MAEVEREYLIQSLPSADEQFLDRESLDALGSYSSVPSGSVGRTYVAARLPLIPPLPPGAAWASGSALGPRPPLGRVQ